MSFGVQALHRTGIPGGELAFRKGEGRERGGKVRNAETVTFGGSGLNRGAELRKDESGLADALRRGWVLPLWRGKVLASEAGNLAWLRPGDPALVLAREPVFLGLDGDQPRFAADLSDWMPETGADAVPSGFMDPTVQHHPALGTDRGFHELRGLMTHLTAREAELAATAKALVQWHRSHGFCAACGAASQVTAGGWQRSCAACGAQHFPRTDPVVIMLVTRGNAVLLGRSPGWPEGMFSVLAGFVEPGETLEAAVRREVFEEAGITCGEVGYLASQPWPFPASLMIGMRTEATSGVIMIDPEELEQALWVSREDLVGVLAGQHPTIRPPRRGAIAEFLLRNWLADRLD
jgi:NAD+ diphosphatase